MEATKSEPPAVWRAIKPFVNGGMSGMMATSIIQPVDMVKVQLQLGASGGPISIAKRIIQSDGVRGLYKGLSAGLTRQATYTTARLGLYTFMADRAKASNGGKNLPLWQKFALSMSAGGIGAVIGNPADVTLIRMQSDSSLPPEQRRNYKGVGDALLRIARGEGFPGLFCGAGPTAARAMALNTGMLVSNATIQETLESVGLEKTSNLSIFGSAMISGVIAATLSLPFDFIKTRLQKMAPKPDGTMPYKGPLHCALVTFQTEGVLAFYTGYPTYCVRIAPHSTMCLIFMAFLPRIQQQFGL